jgi:26S proteasome regulatory subunit (ATPase 3-interacting protein)
LVFLADVSANIKGVVSKAMTQKILTAAAERGEITQKTYGASNQPACARALTLAIGKATYFVAKQVSPTLAQNNTLGSRAGSQEDMVTLPQEQLEETAKEVDRLNEENKELSAVSKSLLQGISHMPGSRISLMRRWDHRVQQDQVNSYRF